LNIKHRLTADRRFLGRSTLDVRCFDCEDDDEDESREGLFKHAPGFER